MKIDFGLFHTYQQACFQMRLLIESSLSYFFHDVHFALTNICMNIRKSTYKQAISFQSGTTCKKKGCHPHGELCSIYVHQAWSMYIAKNGHPLKWQILIKLILYKFEILRFLPDQHDLNSKSLILKSPYLLTQFLTLIKVIFDGIDTKFYCTHCLSTGAELLQLKGRQMRAECLVEF